MAKQSRVFKLSKLVVLIMIVVLMIVSCKMIDSDENSTGLDNNEQQIVNNDKNDEIKDDNEKNDKIKDESDNTEIKDEEEVKKPVEIDYQAVKPNELGHIMVIMYHGIIDLPPYHVTEEQFLEQLQYMYDHKYRPISVRDYIDNNINIEAGYTPIVFTFDDGLSSTFSLIEKDGNLVPKPGTAIEILERFSESHPGFDSKAGLYINGQKIFEGAGTVEERIKWLVDNGYDVGNHTVSHDKTQMLSKLDSRQIMKNIGIVDQIIKNAVPGYKVDSLAYTFGNRPVKALRNLVLDGEYNNIKYNYSVAFKEGASALYYPPLHIKFDPLNVARARGSKGEIQDMGWFFDYYEQHPEKKYISDGNPHRISILEKDEDSVNKDKLGQKELYLYKLNQ
ncbi:polysaccharide deacetylase family protein [Vallitalea sp.]|uniref:polysaccharide deacetylase family protein n=1 Tax=Vallitalea sp. TaxID=1882829 RepID=UPI0025D8E50A|nr:polysaccharide deacetylase family protein [Vallitalea sp.]MCT4686682.1 polysaccharide deacetylase family protein [Vallitalea sp.]